MADPTTPAKGLTQPNVGGDPNNWGNLLNANLALVDAALGGTLSLSISGNTTLNSTQAQNAGYEFSGTLTAAATITWPGFFGMVIIQNGTTGGYSITCGMNGTTVTILNGETAAVWSDGTNFHRVTQVGGGIGSTGSGEVVLATSPTLAGPLGIGGSPSRYLDVFVGNSNPGANVPGHQLRIAGYQAGLELWNSGNNVNYYLAVDDNDSNKLKMGQGYGPGQLVDGQPIAPFYTYDTTSGTHVWGGSEATWIGYGSGVASADLFDIYSTTNANCFGVIMDGSVQNLTNLTHFAQAGTVTISIASPAVITWPNHGLTASNIQGVMFTTTGELPTGLTAGQVYWLVASSVTTDTFEVSASAGGDAINTSGSQSGTQSCTVQTIVAIAGNAAHGSIASPSPVLAGDILISISGRGLYGTSLATDMSDDAANMQIIASEAWSEGNNGTYINFQACANGEMYDNRVNVMQLYATGPILIGTTSFATGGANNVEITKSASLTGYNVVTLNNYPTDGGNIGLMGGGPDDEALYAAVPSSGQFVVRSGTTNVATINSSGITTLGGLTTAGGTLLTTTAALTAGSGSNTATLGTANAPNAGNPTKWIPIDDDGTTRYIPAW